MVKAFSASRFNKRGASSTLLTKSIRYNKTWLPVPFYFTEANHNISVLFPENWKRSCNQDEGETILDCLRELSNSPKNLTKSPKRYRIIKKIYSPFYSTADTKLKFPRLLWCFFLTSGKPQRSRAIQDVNDG